MILVALSGLFFYTVYHLWYNLLFTVQKWFALDSGSGIKRGLLLVKAGSHFLPAVSLFVCCYNSTLVNNDREECVGDFLFFLPEEVQIPAVQRALLTGACPQLFYWCGSMVARGQVQAAVSIDWTQNGVKREKNCGSSLGGKTIHCSVQNVLMTPLVLYQGTCQKSVSYWFHVMFLVVKQVP